MAWLELDDRILEHPKFIRAVKLAGSEAVHLWLGLKAYCGQHLTDGEIPADMLDEVRGPSDKKKRAAALEALVTVGLVERHADGSLWLHDYLQWSSSRETVLDRREKARERKARSRDPSRRDNQRDSAQTDADVTPAVTNPSSLSPSPPLPNQEREREREPQPRADDKTPKATETRCPRDLLGQPKAQQAIAEFAEAYPQYRVEQIRDGAEEFVRYWTVGGGAEEAREDWFKKLRVDLKAKCDGGTLRPMAEVSPRRLGQDHHKAESTALARGDMAEYDRLVGLRKLVG